VTDAAQQPTTWTAQHWDRYAHLQRAHAPQVGDERAMLRGWLEFQRLTLLDKLRGLDAEQLRRRAIAPSDMSLLGLIRHSTDGEIALFRVVALGEEVEYLYGDDTPLGGDFAGVDDADIGRDLDLWVEACDHSRRIEADLPSLDASGHELWPDQGDLNLRWVMVHMIEEYARHNGHADLLREVIDGEVGY
jgi:hypothetical protein